MKAEHEQKLTRIKQQRHSKEQYANFAPSFQVSSLFKKKNNLFQKAVLIFCVCLFVGMISHFFPEKETPIPKILSQNDEEKKQGINANLLPLHVSQIFDGDSFDAQYNGEKIRIRLYGIDSPEKKQTYGTQSRKALQEILDNNPLAFVDTLYHDPYGRAVSIVYFEHTNIQEMLLQNGETWVYTQFCDTTICDKWKNLQKQAKKENKGLWQNKNPLPPWQWRRNNK